MVCTCRNKNRSNDTKINFIFEEEPCKHCKHKEKYKNGMTGPIGPSGPIGPTGILGPTGSFGGLVYKDIIPSEDAKIVNSIGNVIGTKGGFNIGSSNLDIGSSKSIFSFKISKNPKSYSSAKLCLE
jgi:hypothetical protein